MNIINIVKKNVKTKEKKTLIENFLSLSVLQIANYILPLITLPYLVRVLGPEKFGLIAFAQAFVGYFMILTDYGFNLSATREISINRENKEKVSEIFSSVMIIKFALLVISLILMTIIIFSFDKFSNNWIVYYLTFGMVVGQVLFPVWFFQGMEKMKYTSSLNMLSKVIFTIAIFVFIKKSSDYFYVPLLNSIGYIIAGILGLSFVFRNYGTSFILPSLDIIKSIFMNGWYLFISNLSISFYKNNSIVILGIFANNEIVGYFTVAKKLIDVANQLASIISQTIYPYISNQIYVNSIKIYNFLYKVGLLIFAYTLLLGLIFFIFSSNIIYMVSGNFFKESIISLKIIAFVPMVIGINVPAVQILLGKGLDKKFLKAVFLGALIDIILNFLLVPFFSYKGSCISVLIAELSVTMLLYLEVFKQIKGKRNG